MLTVIYVNVRGTTGHFRKTHERSGSELPLAELAPNRCCAVPDLARLLLVSRDLCSEQSIDKQRYTFHRIQCPRQTKEQRYRYRRNHCQIVKTKSRRGTTRRGHSLLRSIIVSVLFCQSWRPRMKPLDGFATTAAARYIPAANGFRKKRNSSVVHRLGSSLTTQTHRLQWLMQSAQSRDIGSRELSLF